MTRIYGQWAGNEKGQPENPSHCVESVPSEIARGMVFKQCARPRGKGLDGLYCTIHARRHPAASK